ncbi:hypothetical protein PAXRUDRAFT_165032 [Paxillus rubicundulus Ve08.2h10]|uniref:Uncharacterized protein n=1 Tax=Paxillus rubicundulus Ve08.2h10 TaxID=930991 RepID=A0A0D0CRQ6_9AGAM|nr:hypothetical protein PAXRUDRAFT_165032 [Paxillus rubicundulus Ve08.2h10]
MLSGEEPEELQDPLVMWPKGHKSQEILPASSAPGPSAVEVNIMESCTTILIEQLAKQLANMRSWETTSNKMDLMANAEDLEHVALKVHLAESEQERMAMTMESAQAHMMINNLQSMYTGMSQFLQFNSTVGGPGGILPSALGGQAGLSQ